jgi:hypothetical protein
MQPCAHGLRRQAKKVSGFRYTHLLDVAHDTHDAVMLRQTADRPFQKPANIRSAAARSGSS